MNRGDLIMVLADPGQHSIDPRDRWVPATVCLLHPTDHRWIGICVHGRTGHRYRIDNVNDTRMWGWPDVDLYNRRDWIDQHMEDWTFSRSYLSDAHHELEEDIWYNATGGSHR